MQIGPERPDERGRVPATAVASRGTAGTGGHGWGHRRLFAGWFWRLRVPEGLRCEDGVCSSYGVQDARLWCRIGTQPAPRPPLPMHGLGMGWFWAPLPSAGSAWPYCRAQEGCMGLGGPQIPPVRPPGCLLQGNSTQICLVQGVGIVWWLYGRADPRAPLKAPGFFFLHLAFDQRKSFHEGISEQKAHHGRARFCFFYCW